MKWLIILFFPVVLFSQSNFTKARETLDKEKLLKSQLYNEGVLKNNPNSISANENLGDIAAMFEDWDKAIKYFGKLKSLKPNVADYQYKYGGALGMKALHVNKFRALGMVGDIRNSFEKAVQLDPKHVDARWALVQLYLKMPVVIGGSESKAIFYSNELLMLSPVDGYLSRGMIEENYERYKSAENMYKKAIAIGGSKHSYQTLAKLYKNKMDAPEKARIILEQYKEKNTDKNTEN